MAEIINGYELLGPLTNANAGYGRWGFASRDGVEYFIKEFLNPIYPTENSPYPEEMQEKIREGCREYQKQKQRLYRAVNETSDGILVRIEEFFRWGSKYYITTRRVPSAMGPESLYREEWKQRLRVCCVLCHALMRMHEKNIVHADVKADNIIITWTPKGEITARLIDVDCSFFENTPPEEGDELGGDQKFLSPEAFLFKHLGPEAVQLGCKMDVYAMGLLIHQLLTGGLPSFDADYNYAFEASLDDQPIHLSSELPEEIRSVLQQMLEKEPEKRPAMEQVFSQLRHVYAPESGERTKKPAAVVEASPMPSGTGRLKFGGFERAVEMFRENETKSGWDTSEKASPSDTGSFFSKGGNL